MVTNRNKSRIIRLYEIERKTMHEIAAEYSVSGGKMRRILLSWGIAPRSKSEASKNRPPFTEAHKKKLSIARKKLFAGGYQPANKGKKASTALCIKNMLGKMGSKLDFSLYTDYNKLKFLTYYLSKHRNLIGNNDFAKSKFLQKFYFDAQFSRIYKAWLSQGKTKWLRPSLDHIVPKSRGGKTVLANLQFLTWFENRAKAEMTEQEWFWFKKETCTKSKLFINNRKR